MTIFVLFFFLKPKKRETKRFSLRERRIRRELEEDDDEG